MKRRGPRLDLDALSDAKLADLAATLLFIVLGPRTLAALANEIAAKAGSSTHWPTP